jgi:hypothetical protein
MAHVLSLKMNDAAVRTLAVLHGLATLEPSGGLAPALRDADLLARRARAEHEAWLGEVEGIDLTLTFLRQKREETNRLARIAPVELGMPATTRP